MKVIEIDITNKVVRIECSNCDKEFLKSFDELAVSGIVICPHCGHDHFLIKIKP